MPEFRGPFALSRTLLPSWFQQSQSLCGTRKRRKYEERQSNTRSSSYSFNCSRWIRSRPWSLVSDAALEISTSPHVTFHGGGRYFPGNSRGNFGLKYFHTEISSPEEISRAAAATTSPLREKENKKREKNENRKYYTRWK